MTNYYHILGISYNASLDDIKKAYRNKAKLHHPDVSKSDKAQDFFVLLNDAHTILTDEKKRQQYDLKLKYGHASAANKTNSHKTNTKPYSNFHYDWESFKKAHVKKRGEKKQKDNSIIFNSFLGAIILSGTALCSTALAGILTSELPLLNGAFILLIGAYIIKDGWEGIQGKEKSYLKTILNTLQTFFK